MNIKNNVVILWHTVAYVVSNIVKIFVFHKIYLNLIKFTEYKLFFLFKKMEKSCTYILHLKYYLGKSK